MVSKCMAIATKYLGQWLPGPSVNGEAEHYLPVGCFVGVEMKSSRAETLERKILRDHMKLTTLQLCGMIKMVSLPKWKHLPGAQSAV